MKTFTATTRPCTSPRRAAVPSGSSSLRHAEVRQILHGPRLQPKLTVGAPDDKFESEADRVADQVMRTPDSAVAQSGDRIQRVCTECDEKEKMRRATLENSSELVQAKARPDGVPQITDDLAGRIRSLKGGGQPLPESTRLFFEPRFGTDFSEVRAHTGPYAADLARRVEARAFTVGRDIVFGQQQYAPNSHDGKKLLAHELTHTVQQTGLGASTPAVQRKLEIKKRKRDGSAAESARGYLDFLGLDHKFYQLTDASVDRVIVEARSTDRPPLLEHEIVWALARSGKVYPATVRKLRREIIERRGIVKTARKISGQGLRFGSLRNPGGTNGCSVNRRFWQITKDKDTGEVVIKSRKGAKPSDAIDDFDKNTSSYAIECFGAVAFVQFLAMRRRMSAEHFDAAMGGQIIMRFAEPMVVTSLATLGHVEVDIGSIDAEHELIPADQANWRNEKFNENMIYLGGGEYFAHHFGIISGREAVGEEDLKLGRYRYRWQHWPSGRPR